MSLVFANAGSLWLKKSFTIPASSTLTVDSLSEDAFEHLTYILQVRNATRTKVTSLNLAIDRVSTDLDSIVYAKTGKLLSIEVDPQLSAGTYTLNVTNSETEEVELRLARIFLK